MGESETEVTQSIQKTIQFLIQARFVVNLKSELAPTQGIVYIGAIPQVDLFTTLLNHQLSLLFCRTSHPLAATADALSQLWTVLSLYAFPPIQHLKKIRKDKADKVIIITPSRLRMSWYHLRQMACEIFLLLSCRRNFLSL